MLLYKPWRRRIDKKRVQNAHFEPLSQDPNNNRLDEEEQQVPPPADTTLTKNIDVDVAPVESIDAAGPAYR